MGSADPRTDATAALTSAGLSPPARRFDTADLNLRAALEQVRRLDEHLTAHPESNGKDLVRVLRDLDGTPAQVRDRWKSLFDALSNALVLSLLGEATVDLRGDVVRLLLVISLVDLLAGDAGSVATPADVAEALRWRHIQLPTELETAVTHSVLARPPAVDDMYVVREEWNRYEPAEIAHIESVLKGEVKERVHERTEESETTETEERETTTVAEQDNQTTDRFELAVEAQRDVTIAMHIEGKVDTSGQYGPTHVDTHVGGSLDYSLREAERRAVKQATESVARATSRIEEHVRTQRVRRNLLRVVERNTHTLTNATGKDNISGIYRWVDKVQRLQIFRYPNRLLFEFHLPEPGAMTRWRQAQPGPGPTSVRPTPYTLDGKEDGKPLLPSMIGVGDGDANKVDYRLLAARYFASGVTPPPADQQVVVEVKPSAVESDVVHANKPPVYSSVTTTIPAGYEATDARIYTAATNGVPEDVSTNPTGWLELVLGTDFPSSTGTSDDPANIWRFQGKNVFRGMQAFTLRTPLTGTFPILLATDDTTGLGATVELTCHPTGAALEQWQLSIFEIVQGAYWDLRRRYESELAQLQVQRGVAINGSSPARNRETTREELKRLTIEQLTGSRFLGRPAISLEPPDPNDAQRTAPFVDLAAGATSAAEIQFLEQAFEWENMTYVFYPPYWASSAQWADLAAVEGTDAEFDRFLRAGAVRVVLPARPGFEGAANLYTVFGVIWGGGPAPTPGSSHYLSVAEEVRAQHAATDLGEPGDWWEVRLPTTLVHLEGVSTKLPLKNAAATLPRKPAAASGSS